MHATKNKISDQRFAAFPESLDEGSGLDGIPILSTSTSQQSLKTYELVIAQ
jgi:hypothetical protein